MKEAFGEMNFAVILFCLSLGYLVRRLSLLPKDSFKVVNFWVLFVALPAVTLKLVPTIHWDERMLLPALMPLVVWIGAWLFVAAVSKPLKLGRKAKTAMLLTLGLGNTSFVGFPLVQAYYGAAGLTVAILCDQVTFVLLSTVGIFVAGRAIEAGDKPARLGSVLLRLVRFPPFLAFAAALISTPFVDWTPVRSFLDLLAGTLIPLALFSVGLQLSFSAVKLEGMAVAAGLFYKLLVAPALVLLLALGFGFRGLPAQIAVFEASMASMITAAVIATEFDVEPRLANLLVGVGIPVSLATTALWWFVLGWL